MNAAAEIVRKPSVCPHDCPSVCALDVEVIGARIGRIRGARGADLYVGGRLRQGRPLSRAHPPPGSPDATASAGRAEGLRSVRPDRLGRGARPRRRAISRGGAALRGGKRLALFLCRHDGARHARRHRAPHPRQALFALLRNDLRRRRLARLCGRRGTPDRRRPRAKWRSPTAS